MTRSQYRFILQKIRVDEANAGRSPRGCKRIARFFANERHISKKSCGTEVLGVFVCGPVLLLELRRLLGISLTAQISDLPKPDVHDFSSPRRNRHDSLKFAPSTVDLDIMTSMAADTHRVLCNSDPNELLSLDIRAVFIEYPSSTRARTKLRRKWRPFPQSNANVTDDIGKAKSKTWNQHRSEPL